MTDLVGEILNLDEPVVKVLEQLIGG